MMGPPDFSDQMPPTWEEFIEDYKEFYFDDTKPKAGRSFIILLEEDPIGQINYNEIYFDGSTEIDIWMSSSQFTGLGYGTTAIGLLCEILKEKFECDEVFIAPSLRNIRAIKSYRKSGFQPWSYPPAWFVPDYDDAYLMRKLL